MNSTASARKPVPIPLLITAVVAIVAVTAAGLYFARSTPSREANQQASQEAKTYVRFLQLSDVTMQATENFMNQRVVEVQGKVGNTGPRSLRSVEVYCLFHGINGQEVGRQRLPIVQSKSPLKSGEVRAFRLPFDTVPEEWNQAMPNMVIARITFAE